MDDDCTLTSNPDILGRGILLAIYFQTFLSSFHAAWALYDDEAAKREMHSLETYSVAGLVLAFAILVSCIAQALGNRGLSNYHASVVLHVGWVNSINTFVYVLLYVQGMKLPWPARVKPFVIHKLHTFPLPRRTELSHRPGSTNRHVSCYLEDPRQPEPEDYAAENAAKALLPSVMLGSLHLTVMSALGIWLWRAPRSFGTADTDPECAFKSARLTVFGLAVPFHSNTLRILSLIVYSLFLIPGLNILFPVAGYMSVRHIVRISGLPKPFSVIVPFTGLNSVLPPPGEGAQWPEHDAEVRGATGDDRIAPLRSRKASLSNSIWSSAVPGYFGLGILLAISVILIIDIEATLRYNRPIQGPDGPQWGIGQILALFPAAFHLGNIVKAIFRRRLGAQAHSDGGQERGSDGGMDWQVWVSFAQTVPKMFPLRAIPRFARPKTWPPVASSRALEIESAPRERNRITDVFGVRLSSPPFAWAGDPALLSQPDDLATPSPPEPEWGELERYVRALNEARYSASFDNGGERLSTLLVGNILGNPKPYRRFKFLQYNGETAQFLVDALQWSLQHRASLEGLHKRMVLKALFRLSERSRKLPRVYYLSGVQIEGIAYEGPDVDVYEAKYQGRPVCLKRYRGYNAEKRDEMAKMTIKESILWFNYRHANILTFEGILCDRPDFAGASLVSPFLRNGTVVDFIRSYPHVNRLPMVRDVLHAVDFLHENEVVHGDIKGCNVLINDSGHAVLADFGQSRINDKDLLTWASINTNDPGSGTLPWLSPELMSDSPDAAPTTASDVYALGCFIYEVFTERKPFWEIIEGGGYSIAHTIVTEVKKGGRRPQKPLPSSGPYRRHGLTEEIWHLMESCWLREVERRPTANSMCSFVEAQLSG